ncbi:MAG: DNA polymerase III subunit gamma/tau, partial [Deltaproteobacteria bacterium]|nr:DNA polymerase III subunit gamma/tau [Deltaproteobacteria bacterium]
GPTPEPCDQCNACSEIANGSAIDVYEIDGASNRGIDEVRQIIENVKYQPAKSRFKIYIIDEVHQVTKDAFNALLKTLEEPPSFVKFILATTEPHRLPETILSRCQRFDFRRITVREIIQRLSEISKQEGLQITEGALLLLAREAEGSMRDAQSLLEQVLSYAAPGAGAGKAGAMIDESLLQEILGVAERKVLYDLSNAVVQGDAKRCVELVADVVVQGWDIPRLSRELVEHFRNLLVVRLTQESPSSSFSRLLDLPDQEVGDLKRQATELSVDTLLDYFRFMARGDEEVARSAYPRFALETVLVRLATLPKAAPIAEVVERLERMERRLSGGAGHNRPRPGGEERAAAEKAEPEGQPPESGSAENGTEEVWRKFVAWTTTGVGQRGERHGRGLEKICRLRHEGKENSRLPSRAGSPVGDASRAIEDRGRGALSLHLSSGPGEYGVVEGSRAPLFFPGSGCRNHFRKFQKPGNEGRAATRRFAENPQR